MLKTFTLYLVLFFCISFDGHASEKYAGFPEPQTNFQAHIEEVKHYLLSTQMEGRDAEDVQYNLPFEQTAKPGVPYRGRFLLIHGLNDSPYVFSDVASELTDRGYDVRAILLPGHGNSPEAQLKISYRQWLSAAREQLRLWRKPGTPMHLGGFSMGSVISTILALEDESIDGLLLFSPAFKSTKHKLLRWSSLYSRFKPWIFGSMIIEDNPTKYNSVPVNGGTQYYNLTRKLKNIWQRNRLEMPVLIVASRNDSVVDVDFLIQVFNRRFTSDKKRLLIYSNEIDELDTDTIDIRLSAYPELRIINQSHQSVLIAPSNPLLGKDGSILVCNGNDWETFSACLYTKEKHWHGAQGSIAPDTIPVARITYNPDFTGVFAEFDRVFK